MLVRMLTAQTLQARLAPAEKTSHYFWLAPFKDLFHFVLWLLAFFGNRIVWRGKIYRLQRDGKLIPVISGGSASKVAST
jgi:ceramide glucosyltransferase